MHNNESRNSREGTPRRSAPQCNGGARAHTHARPSGEAGLLALTRHQPAPATAQTPGTRLAARLRGARLTGRRPSLFGRRTPVASRSTLLLVLVCMAQFMIVLDISIVNVALPSIRSALGFSTTGLQWVVNAYTLTFAGFLMLGGRAADLLGRRRMFLVGTSAFALASLVCAAASSRGLLIGARALQGVSGAVVSPATLAILTTSFADGAERNRAVGIWGAMSGLGASAGALIGGVLTSTAGWSSIFLVNVPIGLFVVLAGRRLIAESRGDGAHHFDFTGAALVTLGLVAVVFGIVRSNALGWGAAGVLGPLAGGLGTLALFAFVEHRVARAPLVPLSIFRRPQLRAANLVVLLLYGALFATFFFVTLYMQQVLRYSPLQAGLGFLPMTLGVFVASNAAPRAIARLGARRTVTLGMLLAAAGLACFTAVRPHAGYLEVVLPGSLLSAAGMGLALVSATVAAVQGVPSRRERPGVGTGELVALHRRRPRPGRAQHARRRAHPHRAARRRRPCAGPDRRLRQRLPGGGRGVPRRRRVGAGTHPRVGGGAGERGRRVRRDGRAGVRAGRDDRSRRLTAAAGRPSMRRGDPATARRCRCAPPGRPPGCGCRAAAWRGCWRCDWRRCWR